MQLRVPDGCPWRLHSSRLNAVAELFGSVSAIQIEWTDSHGNLPWEEGYAYRSRIAAASWFPLIAAVKPANSRYTYLRSWLGNTTPSTFEASPNHTVTPPS